MLQVLAILLGSTFALQQNTIPASVCDSLIDGPMLVFDRPLEDTVVPAGSDVTLHCSVYGAPQASISWYHRGKLVDLHPAAALELAIPSQVVGNGLVESKLRVPCISQRTAGEYTCEATNNCGQTISSSARIMVKHTRKDEFCNRTLTEIPWISLATMQRIELLGNPVQLMCRARGNPAPMVKWERIREDDSLESIGNRPEFMALSNGDLLVIGDESMVAESFRCTALNPLGQAYIETTLLFVDEE